MKMLLLLVYLLCQFLSRTLAIKLSVPNDAFGVPESLRIWSIVNKLALDNNIDASILNELYPVITKLEELDEAQSVTDLVYDHLNDAVSNDMAQFFKLFDSLYPMGLQFEDDLNTPLNNDNFFMLNDQKYSKPDDVFYLKSKELKNQAKLGDSDVIASRNDVVIGKNADAPILLFYGCPVNDEFDDFNRNLYNEAITTDKIRFIWRSTCSMNFPSKINSEFPLTFTVNEESDLKSLLDTKLPFNIPHEFTDLDKLSFAKPTQEELSDMDMKVTSFLVNHYQETKNLTESLEYTRAVLNNYPFLMQHFIEMQPNKKLNSLISRSNEELERMGIDYKMLGLYINGQNHKYSTLDQYTLLNAIYKEYREIQNLQDILEKYLPTNVLTPTLAKDLLNSYSSFSLPHLKELQPIKLDLHRIRGFSESVIYFNDIEEDEQYEELEKDATKFFEKSKFGEIPEYRRNWAELIFVINFDILNKDPDTQHALMGLNRAVQITGEGYPQRIGLLPLGSRENPIVKKIYELKDTDSSELKLFLEELGSKEDVIFSDFSNIPNVGKLLKQLQIAETSIIVNGEIYPFKMNTWNYLIAKVIKKDVAFIKQELNEFAARNNVQGDKNVDVRALLHLKSADSRHPKYTPDYFADSVYTKSNDNTLNTIPQNIIEFSFSEKYNILHTITLYDNFDSQIALKRLKALSKIKFHGIRIRMVHSGDVTSSNWISLKNNLSSRKQLIAKVDNLITKSYRNIPDTTSIPLQVLHSWLPDIPLEHLKSHSFFLFNGRFIHLDSDEVLSVKRLQAIVKREAQRTLDTVYALNEIDPAFGEKMADPGFIETVSSILTMLYYKGTTIYEDGIEYTTETTLSRMDFSQILAVNNITYFEQHNHVEKPVDLLLIIDPLEERTQHILSLLSKVENLEFINIKVLLISTLSLNIVPIERVYTLNQKIQMKELRENDLLNNWEVDIETPTHFSINSFTRLESTVIEVHAFNEDSPISGSNVDGIGGVRLQLLDSSGSIIDTLSTMTTFGYGQFHLNQLGKNFTIKSADDGYEVESFSLHGYADYVPSSSFDMLDFNPKKIYIKVKILDRVSKAVEQDGGFNIFSVLKTHEDEESYKRMILSILLWKLVEDDTEQLTFWILDQPFISEEFKQYCEIINEQNELRGKIRFIDYDWPAWLRPQRFRSRKVDISKLLFLDVLFPENITSIVYMAPVATPIDPSSLFELDAKAKSFRLFRVKGKGYWDEGYWEKVLKENNLSFYSIGPAFLMNLDVIRANGDADKLRIHYQRLSADPKSLINIDQDLLNDLQTAIPMGSLRRALLDKPKLDTTLIERWESVIQDSIAAANSAAMDKEHDEIDYKNVSNDETTTLEEDEDYFHDEL
ncbi:hypothetical protein KAFR_0E02400 [Kazachstania africana CBS 2517]|uniref:Killer toxin-resistance protein 5 n=1 Tax=Kazachstania africana (strain ATCC 22294 / BCRC 22015 / CBS 2517 / CECT 1963 / NBRC 1671 / NRRL Y-8276) TaxID=1071382 RepID=H2AVJ3_KAZAF|nr:hypothetical protein KAFR_0E02400 [Kazachstania africana CBS 2517]CCF58393.1 hypothetical protein KAFR_0E02400 [Kazachstania africana CBS 2517]